MRTKILGYDGRDVRDGDEHTVLNDDTNARLGMIVRQGKHWGAFSRGNEITGGHGYVARRGYESAQEAVDALVLNSTK